MPGALPLIPGCGCLFRACLLSWNIDGELGVVRLVDRLAAVMLEGPVMLLVSYKIPSRVIKKYTVFSNVFTRIAMGASSLLFLLSAEFFASVYLQGTAASEYVSRFASPEGAVALILFLLFPAIPFLSSL